ncbi:MAG: type II secretion system F family protein [Burkholderiales bacterium]|nr:type II secretion system F family protein [Burkholderiales bacterium]
MLRSFDYRALDAAGADVRGRVQAEGDVQALRAVAAQGLTPLEVVEAGATGTRAPAPVVRRVKAGEVAQLLQELATLLKGGVALGEALPSLAQAYRSTGLETPLAGIDQAVRSGQHLSEAVKQAGLPLPRYALAVIESGEASGQMAGALEDIHQQMAYDAAVRQEMRNALTYPAILVIAGLAAILIVFVGVVPRFAGLLSNSRANVPEISRWIIELGLFAREHLLWIGMGTAAVAMAVMVVLGRADTRARLLDALARVPLTRRWIMPAEVGRWATLLGTLLANRVPLLEALRLSRDLTALPSLQRHLEAALREVRRGRSLSAVFGEQDWLGPTQVNLVRVGERSGELPRMLRSLGELETRRARQQVKSLLALLEPVAILGIGAVIGFIMVAVMLAITSLNTGAV